MSFEVQTAGVDGELRRSTSLNYNSAYTVIFRFYMPANANSGAFVWGLSGSSSYNGGQNFGSRYDKVNFSGGGAIKLGVWTGSTGTEVTSIFTPTQSAWHTIAVIRSSATSIKMRYKNGSGSIANSSSETTDVSAREAVAVEFMARDDNNGASLAAGSRVTNYKSWSRALSDAEVDAEMFSTAFAESTNKYSGSPMGSESDNSVNDDADGSGTVWTYGSAMIAGSNDPAVEYGPGGGGGVPKSTKFFLMGIG